MSGTLVELCCGTAAVSLRALAGRPITTLTGYMGNKRRWSTQLAELLGFGSTVPDRVVLVDAGPWGDVWAVLRDRERRHAVAAVLRGWEGDPHRLWQDLVVRPPPADDAQRIAQYLWLQARSAGTIPIWWAPERRRWESPTGSRTEAAHPKETPASIRKRAPKLAAGGAYAGAGDATRRQKTTPGGCRGIQYPATIARRLEALDRLPWDRVEVIRGDLRDVEPLAGAAVYFDPPYRNCPRYAAVCPRADVLAVAARWQAAGARVLLSEGEPLELAGWSHAVLARHARVAAGGGLRA